MKVIFDILVSEFSELFSLLSMDTLCYFAEKTRAKNAVVNPQWLRKKAESGEVRRPKWGEQG